MRPISNVYASWTDSGTSYTGIGINVAATAYATTSKPFNVRVNNLSVFSIDTNGTISSNTISALYNTANASYTFANNLAVSSGDPVFAFRHANSAFDKANSSYITVNSAYTTTNSSFGLANTVNASTVKLIQSTQTIYGNINVSGNIVSTNTTSSVSSRQIKSNFYTPRDISIVSDGGYNAFFMVVDGKLYTCHGTQGSWASYQTGRYDGASYQADWGFEGMRRTMFPYETTAKIIQADFSGCYCAYALFDNGNLYTWGYNNYGTCGLGDTSQRYVPTLAATGVTAVYSDGYLTSQAGYTASRLYIKKTDGYIYGAGYNGYGALGLGDTTNRSSFTQMTSLGTNCQYIWNFGADYGSTWAIMGDNSIYVCGYNGYGQFGNGGTSNYYSFIDVTSYFNPSKYSVVKIFGDTGNYNTVAVLLSNGDLYTCGYNGSYQIGNGSSGTIYSPYKVLTGVTNAWSIGGGASAGTFFASKGNVLYAWGYNGYGQCGVNGTSGITSPMITLNGNFDEFMNSKSLDPSGYAHYTTAIIRDTSGNLYAAGWSGYGENGTGSVSNSNTGWNRILLPGDFYPVKVASYCTTGTTREYLAIGADNRMYAWGYNGQYGCHNNNIAQTICVPMQVFARLGG